MSIYCFHYKIHTIKLKFINFPKLKGNVYKHVYCYVIEFLLTTPKDEADRQQKSQAPLNEEIGFFICIQIPVSILGVYYSPYNRTLKTVISARKNLHL
jgi:hypothetical protein